MEANRHTRVLAVGIDSAEPRLVRELIDRGELPALGALLERGRFAEVDSRGDIGSGAVWPTFFTGVDPAVHQMYSGWSWKPDRMACAEPDEDRLTPFWREPAREGMTVGVIDVPWAPIGEIGDGSEIAEYGPHDVSYGFTRSSGAAAEALLATAPRHPFYDVPYGPGTADTREGKSTLSAACLEGARVRGDLGVRLVRELRPDLAIVVFAEVHHCTHQLWHTVAPPDDPMFEFVDTAEVQPDLTAVYREVDRQVGRLIEAAGPETAVMAFSLHGMKPGAGIPMIHEGLLEALGFAVPSTWGGLTWRERRAAAFGELKRLAPRPVKALYHRRLDYATRRRLAHQTIVGQYDWSRTRAFGIPSDQRGFIRVNLAGREARGSVPPSQYEAVLDELVEALEAARDDRGEPVTAGVARTVGADERPHPHLPDLIVDWATPAFANPVRVTVGSTEFVSHQRRGDMTGQHAPHGFCILGPGLADGAAGEIVPGTELHRLLLAPLGADAGTAAAAE